MARPGSSANGGGEGNAPRARGPRFDPELVAHVLERYRAGWFLMDNDGAGAQWVTPYQRALLPLDERFAVSRSLRAMVRRGGFRVTTDAAFGRVIRACAVASPGREETWLNGQIIAVFEHLHAAGHAHSIEAWLPSAEGGADVLVGGLYGLAMGRVFCGESMFSLPALGGSNASKVCLVHLVTHLRALGFVVLDAQLPNPHLEQFGLFTVDQAQYLRTLETHAQGIGPAWLPFPREMP